MIEYPGRTLFSRIFIYGLVVSVGSAAAFLGLSALFLLPALDDDVLGESWLAAHLCEPQRSTHSQRPRDGARGIVASVYSADGHLRRTIVKPPLQALARNDVERLAARGVLPVSFGTIAYSCEESDGGGYVILRRPAPPSPLKALLTLLAVAVLVAALASVPFARSIAKPLERMVGVTKAFGQGDLTVRAKESRQDEVGSLASAFNDMAHKLEQLIRSEQELLANVSHELRTPLSRIRVVLETAQEEPRRAHEMLKEIAVDLADLEGLVENVMETMRLHMRATNGRPAELPMSFQVADLSAIGSETAERFHRIHPDRKMSFSCDPNAIVVCADRQLLRRLLDNLLDNAQKYSDATAPVVLSISIEGETAIVQVADNGIGIDAGDLAHVFQPFFRGDRSRSRATGGAGLGLALAKNIVDAHRGTISVSSTLGQGTRVRVTLPLLEQVGSPWS